MPIYLIPNKQQFSSTTFLYLPHKTMGKKRSYAPNYMKPIYYGSRHNHKPPTKYSDTIIACSKNIYSQHVVSSADHNRRETAAAAIAYRRKHDIVVGSSITVIPNPIESLTELADLPASMSPQLFACGRLSPMQSQSWPIILSGHDMIGLDERGPDRTLAYVLPALLHINAQIKVQPNEGPIVLVLVASESHAQKIFDIASYFGPRTRIAIIAAHLTPREFHTKFERGIEMAIVVSNAAYKLLFRNLLSLKFCSMLILDDVDTLLVSVTARGLIDILTYAPAGRQTLCFSQSWCLEAKALAMAHMSSGYFTVAVGKFNRDVQLICRQVAHILDTHEDRMEYVANLIRTIQSSSTGNILVFVGQKDDSKKLIRYLRQVHLSIASHETKAVSGRSNIFVASDCELKNLNVDKIDHVIHFNYSCRYYGIRLAYMNRSKTNGTSHVILDRSERHAASPLIKQFQYGRQKISAELQALRMEDLGRTQSPPKTVTTTRDKWIGADSILARILDEEEAAKSNVQQTQNFSFVHKSVHRTWRPAE